MITGQVGMGKSTVVNSIRQNSNQRGLNISMVCSSEIACCVYESGDASTVHCFYGLGAADMCSTQLIHCSVGDSRVCERHKKKMDVLILDEASMLRARIIEIDNALHHHLAGDKSGLQRFPFAEKQIIIVGEFLQLCPVSSCFDSGEFVSI